MFGKAIVAQNCEKLGVDLIIRAHQVFHTHDIPSTVPSSQVVQDGYEFMGGRKLITVFSAPNYCSEFTNAAAVVCIDAELKVLRVHSASRPFSNDTRKHTTLLQVSFQQMITPLVPHPRGKKAMIAPAVASDASEPKILPTHIVSLGYCISKGLISQRDYTKPLEGQPRAMSPSTNGKSAEKAEEKKEEEKKE